VLSELGWGQVKRQTVDPNAVTGSGVNNQLAVWTGTSTIGGSTLLTRTTEGIKIDQGGGNPRLELRTGIAGWILERVTDATFRIRNAEVGPTQGGLVLKDTGIVDPLAGFGYNNTPNVTVDIIGAVATRKFDVTLANGDNNNVAISKHTFVRVIGPTLAYAVTGFANGFDGRHLRVFFSVAQTATIKNENVGSTAANRVTTLTGADVPLRVTAVSFADFVYDGASSRWILTSTNGGAV